MKGRSKKYYRKIFRAYPDMVTLLQFREMLSGVSDNFARKLIHEKHVKSIFIKPHYYISKNSVIDSQIAITSWTPRGKNLGHGWSRRIYP